jgi:hypothetical protein
MESNNTIEIAISIFESLFLEAIAKEDLSNDPFYSSKVHAQQIFSDIEKQIAIHVIKEFQQTETVLEIGSGIGQLVMFLCSQNYPVIGIEPSIRHEMSFRVAERLSRYYPEIDHITLIKANYPIQVSPKHDILLATNVVNSFWDNWQVPTEYKYTSVFTADNAIIDLRTWWKLRETKKEQTELLEEILDNTGMMLHFSDNTSLVHVHRTSK